MTQAIDWEAQIEEIRIKATAAARHSERTISGVAQTLSELSIQAKALTKLDKEQQEILTRFGSLESALRERPARLDPQDSETENRAPAALLCGLIGLLSGVVGSGVFFWS